MKTLFSALLALSATITCCAQDEYPVTYTIKEKISARAGSSFVIETIFNVKDPWYIYAPTGNNAAQGMLETNIIFNPPKGIARKGKSKLPKTDFKGGFEVFAGAHIKFAQEFETAENLPAGNYTIKTKISYQTCNEKICLPPKTDELNITITIGSADTIQNTSAANTTAPEPTASPAMNKMNLAFTSMDGRKIDMQSLRGKLVIVDCWATWCKPCINEFANLKTIYKQYHDKGLEIIGINMDEPAQKEKVRKLIKDHQLPWPQYFEGKGFAPNSLVKEFAITSLPKVFLIDKAGNIIDNDARGEKLQRLLEENLPEATKAVTRPW